MQCEDCVFPSVWSLRAALRTHTSLSLRFVTPCGHAPAATEGFCVSTPVIFVSIKHVWYKVFVSGEVTREENRTDLSCLLSNDQAVAAARCSAIITALGTRKQQRKNPSTSPLSSPLESSVGNSARQLQHHKIPLFMHTRSCFICTCQLGCIHSQGRAFSVEWHRSPVRTLPESARSARHPSVMLAKGR